MAGTTISSSTTIGISLTLTSQNPVTVSSSGTINVAGSSTSAIYGMFGVPGTIANDGVLEAPNGYGIRLLSGGTITNGKATDTKASITGGSYGVKFGIHGAGTVVNFGTIANTSTTIGMGVEALANATVTNGSTADTTATIAGYYSGVRIAGAGATVANFGKLLATSTAGSAVYLRDGGRVTNGGTSDTVASIAGVGFGIEIGHAAGTIVNFGTIEGTGTALARGIVLSAGGSVVNGSTADKAAYILAYNKNGVYIGGTVASSVANFGTIRAAGLLNKGNNGIDILPGGTVTNGSAGDTTASIIGERHGVYVRGDVASAVNNFGTIQGIGDDGLSLYLGAAVTNGSTLDTVALITGGNGIYQGGGATIANFGTIRGTSTAIILGQGGSVANGSANDKVADIVAATGLTGGVAAATIANFGTITGTSGSALVLTTGGSVTNGSTADVTARITAATVGVSAGSAAAIVANFGTVTGGTTGVGLATGGSVTNGASSDKTALITGGNTGVSIGGAVGSVMNFGDIAGPLNTGVGLSFGGGVTNGSTADTAASMIGADYGVKFGIHGAGTLTNFGTIASTSTATGSGVFAEANGTVVNGATTSTAASISGYSEGVEVRGSAASVTNFGKISAASTTGVGVYLTAGGNVTNGGGTNTVASIISAEIGVEVGHVAGTVSNLGTIKGSGPFGRGIILSVGGSVTNGSSADKTAYIGANNRNGVYIGGDGSSSVVNFGTIKGTGPANLSNGVDIRGGGTVTNGSTADTTATISGTQHGVYIQGLVTTAVNNFGTITSSAKSAVILYLGGNVTNGAAALISGASGVYIGGSGTVANLGTITGTAGSSVSLREGGSVINGSAADKTAMLNVGNTGTHSAVYDLTGLTTVVNFGTITSTTSSAIHLDAGGSITNGTTADKTATIVGAAGHTGVYIGTGAATVTNFGTITGGTDGLDFTNGTVSATATVINAGTISNAGGTAGTAITFGANNDRLVLDPGAKFIGTVSGGGGANVLELAAGGAGATGSIGSEFVNFGSVVVDAGASWTLTGANTAATATDNGTLIVGSSATLDVTGAVDPASTGVFQLSVASILEVLADKGTSNQLKFLSSDDVIIDHAANFGINVGTTAYAGPLIENFGTSDKIDLKDVTLAGAVLNYASATGLLQITLGATGLATLAFQNSSLGTGTFHIGDDSSGHVLLTHS